jgi:hypothetical protein
MLLRDEFARGMTLAQYIESAQANKDLWIAASRREIVSRSSLSHRLMRKSRKGVTKAAWPEYPLSLAPPDSSASTDSAANEARQPRSITPPRRAASQWSSALADL